ncbi:class I SAM-dependent methyltransferase [Ureibacillus chungkukjangi]|uniref:Site-specific DNA-methyltransferase (Adenine-specific) n=1 Tax=Ureibacillus chungkukjangi TaxID=1202712 RepID=A0A318TWI4_9BACL|nr:class I SAM-dependent methyltransferase [Ureibacillus chungkukjangi]MCM3387465.1 class I SAM-dependent methyltransferase [Ureibacillus chungkukjangi]PYF09052.1 site-specific DNA-methyltransferase (adenine-specific) [Ureibacillus chungkukjangi]
MEKFEQIFSLLNEKAEKYEKAEGISFLDGVLQALEDVLDEKEQPLFQDSTKDDIRKAIQIAILKGMRKTSQPNHQMTPDTLGLLVGYFVEQFFEEQLKTGPISLLDPAVGTGNLLLTVMNLFDGKTSATGIEVDELLIRLAADSAELTEQPIVLYHQDALQKMLVDPVDAVICDLPVGYYPNEEVALEYELCAHEGMSYAHHLFIEQSIKHTKEGGYLFFLIPANMFESEQSKDLHKYLKKTTWIQAVIQLPENLFSAKAHEKSILILQKQTKSERAPREVLLAKVPNMSNKEALAMFFEKVQMWKESK